MKSIGIAALFLSLMALSFPIFAEEQTVSGIPRLIRQNPETEILFKDLRTSYFVPRNDGHNKIFETVQRAIRTGTPVSLRVDPRSRRVLGLAGEKAESAVSTSKPTPEPEEPVKDAAKDKTDGKKDSGGASK